MTQTKTDTTEKETKMITSPIRTQQRPMEEDLNPHRRTAVLVGEVSELRTRPGDERNISPPKAPKGDNMRSFFAHFGGSFPTSREFSRSCSEF